MASKIYDVIVIGAGSVGTPAAYFLSENKLKVLCLEKNPSAGQGQNKAAIGGVRATHSDPAKIKICQKSLEIFSSWKEKHGVEIGWKKGGYCFPVYRENEMKVLKNILPIQKTYGLNIDWLEPDAIKEIVPGINPENLSGGTFSPDDGQVSPLMAVEAFQKAAIANGAVFSFKNEVTGFTSEKGKITGVKTSQETYAAKYVVIAAGAYARETGALAEMNIPVQPDSHEAGINAPVKEFLGPLVVDLRPGIEGKTSNFYFAQNHDGGIIFCYTPSELFKGYDRRSSSEFMPVIAHRLASLIPRLKNLRIRRLWRGLYPMTPDGVPIIGVSKEYDNCYLGVGMCGQGFMMGPGTGKILSELIIDGKPSSIDNDILDSLSPSRNFSAGRKESLK